MKKNNCISKWFNTLAVGLLISVTSFYVCAAQLIPFQARLTDGAGAPVANGVYAINFSIYDTATGGTPVNGWVESHSTVSVMSGVVNVLLGSITPLNDPNNDGDLSDAVTFYTTDGNRFIGVTIGAGQEMVPRHQLIVSFHAVSADDAAKLGGNLPSYYASLTQLNAEIQGINNQLTGAIVAYSGSCPSGWFLADGTSGTPDLRNRFLRGESTGNPISLDFGGNDDAIVVGHNHTLDPPATPLSTDSGGSHNHLSGTAMGTGIKAVYEEVRDFVSGTANGGGVFVNSYDRHYTSTHAGHTHTGSVNIAPFNSASTGSSATNANIPGYYEVIYCVKQ